jgi:hypothetical protein
MPRPSDRERSDRYYGGGRGGYTGGADGRGDRYHGGGRGGYTQQNVERRTRNTERDETAVRP